MTKTPEPSGGARLAQLTQLAQQSQPPLGHQQSELALQATLERLQAERPQKRRAWQAFSLGAAAALLLVVGALTSRMWWSPQALSVNVEGAPLRQDSVVRGSREQQPSLRFSDGTRVEVGPTATLRVRSLSEHGARIVVEKGEIRAEVVHAPLAAWVFEAGPFTVDVKGTSFALAWDDAASRLDLRLERGLLAIHAPFAAQPIALQGGQRLVATTGDGRFSISALSAPDVPRHEPEALAPVAPAPVAAPSSAAAAPSAATPRSAWAQRFAASDFRAIVAEAEQQGLATALAERSLEELALLADAARYTGKTGLARRALLAQRERFGKSARAIDAGFMLGRLEEPNSPSEAARWYDRYLAEAPRGSYASEALGRKMLLAERTAGAAQARPIAAQYASRYPQGPHAQSARRILGE